ncbi:MAG: hypothetical protein GY851_24885, partial [bacterium]|nr:hypothetical protein [bacterium]
VALDDDEIGTYSDTTWTEGEGNDYALAFWNVFPKTRFVRLPCSSQSWPSTTRAVKIVGTWGHGDGRRSSPWDATSITATVADATGTTVTLSETGKVTAGHTILCGTEQLYVSAVSGTSATVERGANGTTAAEQADATVSLAAYPSDVVLACLYFAAESWRTMPYAGMSSETMGDHTYRIATADNMAKVRSRLLGRVRRYGG